jgi:hypothetical protein
LVAISPSEQDEHRVDGTGETTTSGVEHDGVAGVLRGTDRRMVGDLRWSL